jgi:hypothetical protein
MGTSVQKFRGRRWLGSATASREKGGHKRWSEGETDHETINEAEKLSL